MTYFNTRKHPNTPTPAERLKLTAYKAAQAIQATAAALVITAAFMALFAATI